MSKLWFKLALVIIFYLATSAFAIIGLGGIARLCWELFMFGWR